MAEKLRGDELVALIQRVFQPCKTETGLAILVDLPDVKVGDNPDWAVRRGIAAGWLRELERCEQASAIKPVLVLFRNAHTNNGDLPERCWIHRGDALPDTAEELDPADSIPFEALFASYPMMLAPTQFSATAPLKVAAKRHLFRAATMGGFCEAMIPALRIDYSEVNRRVEFLKGVLDRAVGADLSLGYPGGVASLYLDLRFRTAHASGGLLPRPGVAGNLPSGEAYIVPYEGESGPSLTAGLLPVQFGNEVVLYRIENNRAVEVMTDGPISRAEAERLVKEPAYGNIAELGLGVLAAFGIKPIGKTLLDEKLGLHVAFGRSEHFGGRIGPDAFSSPEAVVHIDRVYVPETQPEITVNSVDLVMAEGGRLPLMRDGKYVVDFC